MAGGTIFLSPFCFDWLTFQIKRYTKSHVNIFSKKKKAHQKITSQKSFAKMSFIKQKFDYRMCSFVLC